MTASAIWRCQMVNEVGIYGFCLFKKKSVVWINGSNDINMYGLKPHERLLGSNGLGKRNFKRRRRLFPLAFF